MKLNFTYLTYDSKSLMSYEVVYYYMNNRDTIQKYYYKIRFSNILLIVRNKRTKVSKIYIYKDYLREID